MKSNFVLQLFLIVTFFLPSCSKLDTGQNGLEENFFVGNQTTFQATCSDNEVFAKSYFDEESQLIVWNREDSISVFGSVANELYRYHGIEGSNCGEFVKAVATTSQITFSKYYAVYPYNAMTAVKDEGIVTIEIPSVQKYRKNSFDPESDFMIAATEDINDKQLKFRQVCGFLKLKVYSGGVKTVIKSISLAGNNGEHLAGKYEVDAEDISNLRINIIESQSDTVTIDCGKGIEISSDKNKPTELWIALPPVDFTKGIHVTILDESDTRHVQSTDKSISVLRNSVAQMAPFRVNQAYAGTSILSFGIEANGQSYTCSNVGESTISICVPEGIGLTSLKTTFTHDGKKVTAFGEEQTSGKSILDYSTPVDFCVTSSRGDEKHYRVDVRYPVTSVACWGDSYTAYGYPECIGEDLGSSVTVYNGGVSGESTQKIMARQGGLKTYVSAMTIDSQIKSVKVDSIFVSPGELTGGPYPFNTSSWTSSCALLNPCIINGVEGTLTKSSFKRSTTGEEVKVPLGTEISTFGSRLSQTIDLTIIYMGANAGYKGNYDILVKQHWMMIEHCASSKDYIVLAFHQQMSKQEYLDAMNYGFGDGASSYSVYADGKNHVLDLKSAVNKRAAELLIRTGVYGSEEEISATDWGYIHSGSWPLSFYVSASDVHPNQYGCKAMAIVVEDKMKELGYILNK